MSQLPGCLMSPREHDLLRRMAWGKIVLELGAWEGVTTVELASVAERVWTVDHHRGDRFTGPRDTMATYFANLALAGVEDQVVTVVGKFSLALPLLRQSSFDVVLVDGAHDLDSVHHDLTWATVLASGDGIVVVHDYGRWQVTETALGLLGEPREVVDSLAVWRGSL